MSRTINNSDYTLQASQTSVASTRTEPAQAEHRKSSVSVIICAYNDPDSLKRALRSVLAQTCRNIEVLVSDDAGRVSVKSVCDALGPQFPDGSFRYFRQQQNLGVARNKAWAFAQTNSKYCVFLEHDDEWIDPQFLQSAINHMEQDPGIFVVAGNALLQSIPSSEERLLYRNTDKNVVLDGDWQEFSGSQVSTALLIPMSIRSIVLGTLGEALNFSWSSIVFRGDVVRELGELTPHVLLADDVASALDVYPNEESFMFLHRLLAHGKCLLTGRAVSFRGRSEISFSMSSLHPSRDCGNDVEVFNLFSLAHRMEGEDAAVRKALRKRATSVGLAHVPLEARNYLRNLGCSAWRIRQARLNHGIHVQVRRLRSTSVKAIRSLVGS